MNCYRGIHSGRFRSSTPMVRRISELRSVKNNDLSSFICEQISGKVFCLFFLIIDSSVEKIMLVIRECITHIELYTLNQLIYVDLAKSNLAKSSYLINVIIIYASLSGTGIM